MKIYKFLVVMFVIALLSDATAQIGTCGNPNQNIQRDYAEFCRLYAYNTFTFSGTAATVNAAFRDAILTSMTHTGTVATWDDATGVLNIPNFLTSINSSDINTALGYTPYNSTNPSNYINQAGARTSISAGTGIVYNNSTGVVIEPWSLSRTIPAGKWVRIRSGNVTGSASATINSTQQEVTQ